jgi:hypothetical protein
MDRALLAILMPAGWALISVVAALLLYRSSQGAIDGDQSFLGVPIKGLRLGGSVVIFIVCFFLLKLATPTEYLQPIPKGAVVLPEAEFRTLHEAAEQIEADSLDLDSCLQTNSTVAECEPGVSGFRRSASAFRQRSTELRDRFAAKSDNKALK